MWIRSQDKRQLLNVNDFRVQGRFINSDEKMANLGEYSTLEKALKVMDMIAKEIHLDTCQTKVFKMPQDSEVEEDE